MAAQLLSIPQLPLQLTYDQEQALKAIIEFLNSDQTLFLLGGYAGTGKAQPIHTPVLTPTGWIPIGRLKPGDFVIAGDGSRTRIIGVFPQGIKPVARVKFSDGSSTLCCYDHLWLTESDREPNANRVRAYKAQKKGRIPQPRMGQVKTTREIAESLTARNGAQSNHRIPVIQCADFEPSAVPIAPYLLGCLLGDGGLTSTTPKLTTNDAEIVTRCRKIIPEGVDMRIVTKGGYRFVGTQWRGQHRHNPLTESLKYLGLWGKYSYEKFIPGCYLINSKEVRLELLRGLLDTDGTISQEGYETSFITSSPQLAADVRSLVESLGGICPVRTKDTASGRLCYVLSICLPPDINAFHLPSKRDCADRSAKGNRVKPKTRYAPARYIVSVEAEGKQECVCIAVEHPSQLYVTEHCIVTHNTTMVSLLVKALVSTGKRIALTAPTNKAVNVLQRMAAKNSLTGVDFFTIHQLLGLGMVTRAGEKVLERTGSSYAHAFHVVFIDECSMIGEQLWHWIEDAASLYAPRLKIVLMGDPAQLNPVNEKKSPSFSVTNRAVLKQVVRQGADSPLLEFVTACRQTVTKSKEPFQPFPKHSDNKQNGVFIVRQQALLKYACKKMNSEFDNNPDCFRILCWTNKQVDWYNQHIRTHLYGANAGRFVIGERLITRDPVVAPDGKTVILPTSSEAVVADYCEDRYAGYKAWRVIVVTDNGVKQQIYVLHEDDQQRFNAESERLKDSAQKNPLFWRKYYNHLETFANVRPCFALTVHNSQGSTFDEVAIDANDLNKRAMDGKLSSVRELNRLWYVGSTRAKERVIIVK